MCNKDAQSGTVRAQVLQVCRGCMRASVLLFFVCVCVCCVCVCACVLRRPLSVSFHSHGNFDMKGGNQRQFVSPNIRVEFRKELQ